MHNPLVFRPRSFQADFMSKRIWFLAPALALMVGATGFAQVELANLREDIRGLTQRVGELSLRVEQLERENGELHTKSRSVDKSYVTLVQLNEAVADLNRVVKSAVANSKAETLQHVATQMEKLAKQTNAALEAFGKNQTSRSTGNSSFTEDYPKEGVSYTVQKGDTLAVIAKKTGAKQQDIINANKISDPARIILGQTLFIPLSAK
jgi:LysM repeat protein